MPMTLTVQITGLQATGERLDKIKAALSDMSPVMESLGPVLIRFFEDTVFNSSGQALGATWAPLQPKYSDWKRKEYPGKGILEETGDMRHSFDKAVVGNGLYITNTDPKFIWHQNGTGYRGNVSFGIGNDGGRHIGRGNNLPARKMLGINDTVETIFKQGVEKAVRERIDAVKA